MATGRKKILILLLSLLPSIWTLEECSISGIDFGKTRFRNIPIEDTKHGIIEKFTTKLVKDVSLEDETYLKISHDNGEMTIRTTDEFELYEKKEFNTSIITKLNVVCDNQRKITLDFVQPIMFTNNNNPTFNETEYTFVLYNTVKDGVNLGKIADIAAYDYDIDMTYFYFSTDDDDFRISSGETHDKAVIANLYAERDLIPPYKKTFTVKVHDSLLGGSNTGLAKVNVELKLPNEKIEFTKDNYEGSIVNNVITMKDPITLKNGIDDHLHIVVISDYKDFFWTDINYMKGEIQLKTDGLPLMRSLKTIDLTLRVSENGMNATTKISLRSDKDVEEICRLGSIDLKYDTKYRNKKIIDDTYVGSVEVFEDTQNIEDVKCFKTKYLRCKFNKKDETLSIYTTDEFANYEETEKEDRLVMTMTVTCRDYTKEIEYIQDIKDINNHMPEFKFREYNYVFYNQIPKRFKLDQMIEIEAVDLDLDSYGMTMEIEENDAFSLSSKYTTKEKTIAGYLQAKRDINCTSDIELELTVKDKDQKSSTALLKVHVLQNKDEEFEFTKNKYEVYIENGTIHYIDDNKIQLVNGFDTDIVFNITNPYHSKYLHLMPNFLKNHLELEIVGDLKELKERSIILTVLAEWRGFYAMSFVTVYLNGKPAHSDGIQSNLNGFMRWTMTSTIAQTMICLVTLIALVSMIITLNRFFKKRENAPSKHVIDCKV
ncbi:PREDICTED: uncharacterized protein LOC108559064 [Nicrophorus vespilloides]|uniref:Uncharacterized protein LOC108559064 n=1 Tax=Nicrophorus vespilloides TaxID=110193 RepID=A0ABM1MAT2_NICVS|nr:PREDICTED: uncharacterized protein LOC108559064 [Nicrophorus vespilloides]